MFKDFKISVLIKIVIVILSGLAAYKTSDYLFNKLVKQEELHIKYIKKIVNALIIIYTIGLSITQIPTTGNTFSVLLASSGLLVTILGFAAQESLGNVINGLFISIFKPFEIGDRIKLVNNQITGFVEDITLRHTVIRTFTNTRLIVPNSVMNKEMIENSYYKEARAAMFLDVWVSYESDIRKAMDIMANIIYHHKLFLDTRTNPNDPPVRILVRELGESGVCLRATVWTETVDENFITCSDLRLSIKEAFDKNNIEIPYNHIKVVSDNKNII